MLDCNPAAMASRGRAQLTVDQFSSDKLSSLGIFLSPSMSEPALGTQKHKKFWTKSFCFAGFRVVEEFLRVVLPEDLTLIHQDHEADNGIGNDHFADNSDHSDALVGHLHYPCAATALARTQWSSVFRGWGALPLDVS